MVVNVSKDGYFDGNRRFFPISDTESRIKISLLEKKFDQSFTASSGATLTFEAGGRINFAPNSIAMVDGTIFTGEVYAAIKWLDPTDINTLDRMPGSLHGVSSKLEEVALTTYGMVAVELQNASGAPLNLLEGQMAELYVPIPPALLPDSPQTIPLWSFYSEHGLWSEESEAKIENGFYVGSVPHFSFWNCDVPYDLIDFRARILDISGNPITNTKAVVELSSTIAASGYSNGDGTISGKIPADEQLTLKLLNQCGGIMHTQAIGPFTNDTDIGDVTIMLTANTFTHVSGTLLNCTNDPITKGIVIFEFENKYVYEYINSSNFDLSFVTCPNTSLVNVVAVDLNGLKQTDPFEISAGETSDVGIIQICENPLENHIQVTVGDSTYVYWLNWVGMNNRGGTQIVSYSETYYFWIYFEGLTTGSYGTRNTINEFLINDVLYSQNDTIENFTITKFVGEWEEVEGTFRGMLTDTSMVEVEVSGSFYWKAE